MLGFVGGSGCIGRGRASLFQFEINFNNMNIMNYLASKHVINCEMKHEEVTRRVESGEWVIRRQLTNCTYEEVTKRVGIGEW